MRYILQVIVMLSDILIFGMMWIVITAMPDLVGLTVCLLAFWAWKKQGGFFAWKPSNIRAFLKNAKRAGL